MFTRNVNPNIELRLAIWEHASEVFDLVDENRLFLREWLPWLDSTTSVQDVESFIQGQLTAFAERKSLTGIIFFRGEVAGVAGFNSIDHTNGIGYIGYWLGEKFNGSGIMTEVVRDLISIAERFYGLQKVDIRCASGNRKSRAVAERLGFSHEGTLKRAERLHENWVDHEVYALLLSQNNNSEQEAAPKSQPRSSLE